MKYSDRRWLSAVLVRAAIILAVVGLIMIAVALLAGCDPKGAPTDPCAPSGCQVPRRTPTAPTAPQSDPEPLYVAQCHDVADQSGPCVDRYADTKVWIYTPQGSVFPQGNMIDLCPTEAGGPAPCAWVPDVQGNGQPGDDAGAYVYGVDPATGIDGVPMRPVSDAVALADCSDTMMFGPCTYVDDAPDGQLHLYYVDEGGKYPTLKTRDLGLFEIMN